MADKLGDADDFIKALAEVELLLRESDEAGPDKASPNEMKVAVMNKSALLLLMGKFEALLENTAEDFVSAINKLKARKRHIPERLLAEHSVKAVQVIETKLNSGDVVGVRTIFLALGRFWTELDPCTDLKITCEFSYGKHGDQEVIKLFKRIGIENVFAEVVVKEDAETVDEADAQRVVDIKGIINSLTWMRNNILHEDATPNLTAESLRKQSTALQRFAIALVAALQAVLDHAEQLAKSDLGT